MLRRAALSRADTPERLTVAMAHCHAGVFGALLCGGPGTACPSGGTYTWRKNAPMTPQDYVQQKAAASGSSFYYAFLFLPTERRAAITAFYAFCREVDDVVDEVSDPAVAQTKLAWWRREVAQSFAGSPTHPVMRALMPLSAAYAIEARHLNAVIDGCQMDLEQNRYLDFANLQRYCHLVAGVVGEVAANSAIVWTRLTAKAKPDSASAPTLTFQYASGETHQPFLKKRPKHPRSRVTGVKFPTKGGVDDIRYAAPGMAGEVRVLYSPMIKRYIQQKV